MNFKSYGFWTALAGAAAMLAGALGKYFGVTVNGELVSEIIMAIAGVLVALGVVCMPKGEQEENKNKTEIKEEKDGDGAENIVENAVNEDKKENIILSDESILKENSVDDKKDKEE